MRCVFHKNLPSRVRRLRLGHRLSNYAVSALGIDALEALGLGTKAREELEGLKRIGLPLLSPPQMLIGFHQNPTHH